MENDIIKIKNENFIFFADIPSFKIKVEILVPSEKIFLKILDLLNVAIEESVNHRPLNFEANLEFVFNDEISEEYLEAGLPQTSTNRFFNKAAKYESAREKIAKYCQLISSSNVFFDDLEGEESTSLGTFAIASLVLHSENYFDLLIDYLKQVDYEHQDNYSYILETVSKKYKINPKILEVMYAYLYFCNSEYCPDEFRKNFLKDVNWQVELFRIMNKYFEKESTSDMKLEYRNNVLNHFVKCSEYLFFDEYSEKVGDYEIGLAKHEKFKQKVLDYYSLEKKSQKETSPSNAKFTFKKSYENKFWIMGASYLENVSFPANFEKTLNDNNINFNSGQSQKEKEMPLIKLFYNEKFFFDFFYNQRIIAFSDRLIALLKDLGVDYIEYFETQIINKMGIIKNNYKVANVCKSLDCIDRQASTDLRYREDLKKIMGFAPIEYGEKLVIDKNKVGEKDLIFTMKEFYPMFRAVHDKLKVAIEENKITGLAFIPIENLFSFQKG